MTKIQQKFSCPYFPGHFHAYSQFYFRLYFRHWWIHSGEYRYGSLRCDCLFCPSGVGYCFTSELSEWRCAGASTWQQSQAYIKVDKDASVLRHWILERTRQNVVTCSFCWLCWRDGSFSRPRWQLTAAEWKRLKLMQLLLSDWAKFSILI